MKIPLRDFLGQTERQAIIKASHAFGIDMELRFGKLKNHRGDMTGDLKYYMITRKQLVDICDAYLEKYKTNNHYSSFQAYKRHLKNVKQFDQHVERLK